MLSSSLLMSKFDIFESWSCDDEHKVLMYKKSNFYYGKGTASSILVLWWSLSSLSEAELWCGCNLEGGASWFWRGDKRGIISCFWDEWKGLSDARCYLESWPLPDRGSQFSFSSAKTKKLGRLWWYGLWVRLSWWWWWYRCYSSLGAAASRRCLELAQLWAAPLSLIRMVVLGR